MFYASFIKVNNIGLVIAVSGAIRSGKTTLTAGLTHLLVLKIHDELLRKMDEIEIILKEINFAQIKNLIDDLDITLDNYKEFISNQILNFIQIDSLNNVSFTHKLDRPYFDYLNYHNKFSLIENYIEYYLHYKKSVYVLSNIKIYNHITTSYSLDFSNEWIKLKEKKDFPLVKYSIFVEDDKLIYDSNIGHQKKTNEDSGSDLFFRLFGHLFKESSYYICTVQDVNRWIKLEREIAQSHIYVFSSNVVGNFPKLNYVLCKIEGFTRFIYKLFRKVYKNDKYFNNLNVFKKILYKIHQVRKKLFSKSFVLFDCGIYSNINSVGKEIKEDDPSSEKFKFVIPVQYAYGVLDTHAFHLLWSYLYNRSNIKFSDLKATSIDEEEILALLKKYNEKDTSPSNISLHVDDLF